jgi:hypothetical protein
MPISADQIQAPFTISWPAAAATAEYDGGPTKHILITAVDAGTDGNNIDIDATSDIQVGGTLAIDVTGTTIHISLATSDSWTSISTAQEVIDLINNDPEASALVIASLVEGNGSGVLGDGDFDESLSGGQAASTLTFPAGFATANQFLKVTVDNNVAGASLSDFARGLTAAETLPPVAFSSLPASPSEGMLVSVTDSDNNVWGENIGGGGGFNVLAYYNGTNWTVAGK